MNRKLFLRNALMSLAVSLLPKVLQPVELTSDGNVAFIAGESEFDGMRGKWYHYDELNLWASGDMIEDIKKYEKEHPNYLTFFKDYK